MALLTWQSDLDTGIEVIDQQHRRIVDLINALDHAHATHNRVELGEVIEELVDYTISHFSFEEELLDESGYNLGPAHKRVHEMFVKRVGDYKQRFQTGEDVTAELKSMLSRWLFNHIRTEDHAYAKHVRWYLDHYGKREEHAGWLKRTLGRFFG